MSALRNVLARDCLRRDQEKGHRVVKDELKDFEDLVRVHAGLLFGQRFRVP